jgi:uncharacterized protein (TIGR03083 family)
MDIRTMIAAQRRELAELLAGLPAGDWDAPTLCEGWRVREVVAHMTLPFRTSTPRFVLEMVKARGDFNRMADTTARRAAAAMSTDDLAASMRDNAETPWKPPGGGFVGALSHEVIHGLDITVALGVDRPVPTDRMRLVLDGINARSVGFFGVDLAGVRLVADDLDWTYGNGEVLGGSAQDLLLVLCGRKLPAGRLTGAPTGRFVQARR